MAYRFKEARIQPGKSAAEAAKLLQVAEPMTSCDHSTWVVPIGVSAEIQRELRGWYRLRGAFVENEWKQRFYLDNYGVKWLSFNVKE